MNYYEGKISNLAETDAGDAGYNPEASAQVQDGYDADGLLEETIKVCCHQSLHTLHFYSRHFPLV